MLSRKMSERLMLARTALVLSTTHNFSPMCVRGWHWKQDYIKGEFLHVCLLLKNGNHCEAGAYTMHLQSCLWFGTQMITDEMIGADGFTETQTKSIVETLLSTTGGEQSVCKGKMSHNSQRMRFTFLAVSASDSRGLQGSMGHLQSPRCITDLHLVS